MKRKLSLLLALLMALLAFAACGNSQPPASVGTGGTSGGAVSASGGGTAGDPIVIRYNGGNAQDDIMSTAMHVFKEEVEKRSNGNIIIEVYYSNQLADATQSLPMIVKGNFEMTGSGATYIAEYMPELGVLNMGYLYKSYEHADAVLNGELGEKLFQRIAEGTGLLPIGAYYFGARNVCLTIDREVKTPADLADIKLRTNGTDPMMFLAAAMGANPVGIAFNEMYTALQTGTVDGQENPINAVVSMKLYEVSKSLTYTRHYIDFSWMAIGYEFFQSLSEENQQIILESAAVACETQSQAALKAEEEAEAFLKEQGLIFYDPDTSAIREAVIEAYQEKAEQDGWDMELFDEIQAVGDTL